MEIQMAVLQMMMFLLWLSTKASAVPAFQVAKPSCADSCGNVAIPYPFGVGPNCSLDERFEVNCSNNSLGSSKAFIKSINLELLQISLENGTVRVHSPVITSNCTNRTDGIEVNLQGSPFSFSYGNNKFMAMGCDVLAEFTWQDQIFGCKTSKCNVTTTQSSCQTSIPPSLNFLSASLSRNNNDHNTCKYAFIVEEQWFHDLRDRYEVQKMEYAPAVLDWAIPGATCLNYRGQRTTNSMYSCGYNAHCVDHRSNPYGFPFEISILDNSSYLCLCERGFEGNPHLIGGCPDDVNECADNSKCPPPLKCKNLIGDYTCYQDKGKTKAVIIGIGTAFGSLFLLVGTWWLCKTVKRRKKIKQKEKFFKRNGGLLLEQQMSPNEGNVEKTKLFSSKELEKATDNYNDNRILGQGGQGTVYKGMLTDGRIVAVKKSKMVDEGNVEQFINEVVILSQINHRNVVKLLGCCLETKVPMLVYEFIPNGTLSQYIHDQSDEFPLSWDMRLRIATEVAGALSYLHYAASMPIYHRDIKSTNILLDDKYRAKVSDFGTSRSITIDQTHLTTIVQGTFGYLDPEYFQSSQFTEKSDVYSFGVVLAELLTGQKPISSTRSQESRSLATHFILGMEENCVFDILDAQVVKEGKKEELMVVANLAKRCLNLNGKNRPTMKEVTIELEGIKMSDGTSIMQQNYDEDEYVVADLNGPWDDASTSTDSHLEKSVPSSLDVKPLLF